MVRAMSAGLEQYLKYKFMRKINIPLILPLVVLLRRFLRTAD